MKISKEVILQILYRIYKTFIKNIYSHLIIQSLNVHTENLINHNGQHLMLCIG